MAEPRFGLGQVVSTPVALDAMTRAEQGAGEFLGRHIVGDWGDVNHEGKAENDCCVEKGRRILSAYHLKDDTKVWVITEADRSSTYPVA